jgi:hypothetical protein
MKKPEDKQNVFFSGTKIEESHVKLFSKEFNKFHSEEDFFVAKRCIKIDKNGNWIVMQYEGLKNMKDPITGIHFESSIPFDLYRRIQDKIEKKKRIEQYAIRNNDPFWETKMKELLNKYRPNFS